MTPTQQKNLITRFVTEQVAKQADQWKRQTAQQLYAVILKNLHDKFNFTPQELIQIFNDCTNDFECIADKYVKIEDFYELLNELGIKVK